MADEIINPLIEDLINVVRQQQPFKRLPSESRKKQISRLSKSLRKQINQEYDQGRSLKEAMKEKIQSLNDKYDVYIPVHMFDYLDQGASPVDRDANDPVEGCSGQADNLSTSAQLQTQHNEQVEEPKSNQCKGKSSVAGDMARYNERCRELYLMQEALKDAEYTKSKLKLKDDANSGLVSREVLEQSDGFVNARARGIAAFATLDRRLLTNSELMRYGVSFIQGDELEEGQKIASGERCIIFSTLYKGIPAVIKQLRVPNLCRLSQEFLIMQQLSSHQAIQHAFGVLVDRSTNGLVYSYVDGIPLSSFNFKSSIEQGIFVLKLIEVLAHIHKRGVLHNNIRPSHILVKRDETVPVITGFGNACLIEDGYVISQARIQEFGDHCLHTKAVREGKNPVSIASDLQCLGKTLFSLRFSGSTKKNKPIHNWIIDFSSLCCSNSASVVPEDFLPKNGGDLVKILTSINPELFD